MRTNITYRDVSKNTVLPAIHNRLMLIDQQRAFIIDKRRGVYDLDLDDKVKRERIRGFTIMVTLLNEEITYIEETIRAFNSVTEDKKALKDKEV